MKQINGILKTITAYRKQLADIEKRIDNARNVREYDELAAERQIALYDMYAASSELNRLIDVHIQCNNDIMSDATSDIVSREFLNRINHKTK